MLCSRCKKNEANVHFEGLFNNKAIKLDLCSSCAQKTGIPFPSLDLKIQGPFGPSILFPSAPPLISQLFSALSQLSKSPTLELVSSRCPKCRWTPEKFQATGKMGCPNCYNHFRNLAKRILKKVHGTFSYSGTKTPPVRSKPKTQIANPKESRAQLQKQLEKAVKEERYEEAAKLRDQIRSLGENSK